MATKSSGSIDGDSTKSAGGLEKDPSTGDEADAGSGYDYSDSSDGGYSYDGGESGGYSGGSSGDSSGSGSSGESEESGEGTDTEGDSGGTNETGDGTSDSGGEDSGGDGSDGEGSDDGDAGGGGDGGDAGGEPDYPDDGFETLPVEGELPENDNPGDPGNPEDPGNGGRVAVDIDLMITLIASMEQARDEIPELEQRLRSILTDLDLDPSEVAGLDRVITWIEGELPGLRRRLALAQALEEGRLPHLPRPEPPLPRPIEPTPMPRPEPPQYETQPVVRQPVTWDEDHVVTVAPHEATDNGRRAAALIGQSDGAGVTEAAQLMRSHQADPYFAREFASNTDPSLIVGSLAEGEAGTGETDLQALVQSTVTTANQATGELAVDAETRAAWEGALA